MSAVGGLTCPECGRTARRERGLRRSRRRWRVAAAALVVVAIGAGAVAYPRGKGGAWQRWLPDTAVLLALRYQSDPGWAVEEIARRAWGDAILPRVEQPHRFTARQLGLLTEGCLRVATMKPAHARAYTAWGLLTRLSPEPGGAAGPAIALLTSASPQEQYAGARFLLWAADDLAVSDLEAACAALEALAGAAESSSISPAERERAREVGADLRMAIGAREDEEFQRRLAAVGELELTPRGIAEGLGRCTPGELRLLYRRLGLSRLAPVSHTAYPSFSIAAREEFIDDDDRPDCVLEITNESPFMGGDRLYFVRRGAGWRLAGRIERDVNPSAVQEEFLVSAQGHRFLRVVGGEYTLSSPIGGGSGRSDAWYRAEDGRLRLVQIVTTARDQVGYLDRVITVEEPVIVRAGGRDFAAYPMVFRVELRAFSETGTGRSVTLGEHAGEMRFPLDAGEGEFGIPVGGGPWGGERSDWFVEASEEELLHVFLARVLELARGDDEAVREHIGTIISMMEESEEVAAIRAALEER